MLAWFTHVWVVAINGTCWNNVFLQFGGIVSQNTCIGVCFDSLIGIFTERDYMGKVFLKGRASPSTLVHEVMTRNPTFVLPSTKAAQCMNIVSERRVRHLPVCADEFHRKVIGLISIGDLLKYVIEEQKQTIQFLNEYIQRTNYE